MPAVRALPHAKNYKFFPAELAKLQRGRLSPVGRDLEARAIRVTRQMISNASGRPGPEVRTNTLRSSITSRIGVDAQGLFAQIGPLGNRTVKRGYNYALILEGSIREAVHHRTAHTRL